MSAFLDAFKVKPFALDPVYDSWTDAPVFGSKKCKDLPLDDWLKIIKAGCQARKVPKEYWHKVAQHYMDSKARERLDALKRVVENMTGDKYRWNWHKYKMAMRNLGWELDIGLTQTVKVKAKPGVWWIVGRGDKGDKEKSKDSLLLKDGSSPKLPEKPLKDSNVKFDLPDSPVKTVATRYQPEIDESTVLTTTAKAPMWLLNATTALEYLTQEHPKVMTAMSAILITVGTIPAIPAIGAGAGGAILASGAAQAVGAVAVGLGSWIKARTDSSEHASRPSPTRAVTI